MNSCSDVLLVTIIIWLIRIVCGSGRVIHQCGQMWLVMVNCVYFSLERLERTFTIFLSLKTSISTCSSSSSTPSILISSSLMSLRYVETVLTELRSYQSLWGSSNLEVLVYWYCGHWVRTIVQNGRTRVWNVRFWPSNL